MRKYLLFCLAFCVLGCLAQDLIVRPNDPIIYKKEGGAFLWLGDTAWELFHVLDKEEIVRISRKIETFETSILPYEDCCTVFTPRHPKTKPTVAAVEAIEAEMAIPEELVAEAAEQAELNIIRY